MLYAQYNIMHNAGLREEEIHHPNSVPLVFTVLVFILHCRRYRPHNACIVYCCSGVRAALSHLPVFLAPVPFSCLLAGALLSDRSVLWSRSVVCKYVLQYDWAPVSLSECYL